MPITLGYWKLRGLGQHIRFLLEYTETEYTEKRYEFGPAPDFDRSRWLKDKFALGLDFPNLPYYIDGDVKITQSNAILKYIARKHNMIGKTEQEVINADILENEAMDLTMSFAKLCDDSNFEDLKNNYVIETLLPKLQYLSKFLGDKNWFLGENITFVDFFLYEALRSHQELFRSSLDSFENIKQFIERFEALQPIQKYMKSENYMASPINGPWSYFSSK